MATLLDYLISEISFVVRKHRIAPNEYITKHASTMKFLQTNLDWPESDSL